MFDENAPRSWQEIAAEAAQETDPQKLANLTSELCAAFDARDEKLKQMHSAYPTVAAIPFKGKSSLNRDRSE